MSAADEPGPAPWWVSWLSALLCAAVVAALAIFPMLSPTAVKGQQTMQLARAKHMALLLKLYAGDHEGVYPASLSDKTFQDWIDSSGNRQAYNRSRYFQDPATGKDMDWLYYKGHKDSDFLSEPLLASPVPMGEKKDRRVVVLMDNSAALENETKFQQEIDALLRGSQ
jgi:hypothetical protein